MAKKPFKKSREQKKIEKNISDMVTGRTEKMRTPDATMRMQRIRELVKIERIVNKCIREGKMKAYAIFLNMHPEYRPKDFFTKGDEANFVETRGNERRVYKGKILDVREKKGKVFVTFFSGYGRTPSEGRGVNLYYLDPRLLLVKTTNPRKKIKLNKPARVTAREKPIPEARLLEFTTHDGKKILFARRTDAKGKPYLALVDRLKGSKRTHYSLITNPDKIKEIWSKYFSTQKEFNKLFNQAIKQGLVVINADTRVLRTRQKMNVLKKLMHPWQRRIVEKIEKSRR